MQSLYPAEVLLFNTRAKSLAFAHSMSNCAGILKTYVPPIAIAKSGWKFYILYIVWDACAVLVIYLTFPKTRGRNLRYF